MKTVAKHHRYQLWQGGIEVVSLDAPDLESARREIMHYAMMYAQDGPVEIRGDDISALMAPFKDNPPMSGRLKQTLEDARLRLSDENIFRRLADNTD